ncbi:PQQ-binding-like beta-propeller repeat protein [Nocardiopsis valliformis]|uniref:hypothetical protein n=1 Tax=Nocardiopsis valliformis TaxID=239974 RepID=UPI000348E30F|nr:hypothetical protein [Nocardiopsis valliformis]
MLKDKSDRVNDARWLAGALGRAGIVVLAAVLPFALGVMWWFEVPWEEPEGVVSRLWWLPAGILMLFALLMVERIVYAVGNLDDRSSFGHARYLVGLTVLAVLSVFVTAPVETLPLITSPEDFVASEVATGLWVAAILVMLGMALYLGTLVRPPERPRGRWRAGALTGALVVLLAAALVTPLSEYRPVTHTFLSEAPGEPAPVPTGVSEVGWTWTAPENAEVVRVEAGTHGSVVVLADGLVGLDGQTGEELWSYRARYSRTGPGWGTGAFDHRNDLASVIVTAGSEGDRRRLVLDTSTGQIVEEAPFTDDASSNHASRPHTTPEAYVYGADWTLRAVDVHGQELWERPYGEGDPDRYCVAVESGVQAYDGQIIIGEMCADSEPEESDPYRGTEWGQRIDAARASGMVSLVALDAVTGAQMWRREWAPHEEEYPPVLIPGGDPRPGADPVFLLGDRAFDTLTGQDLDVVPAEFVELDRYGLSNEGAYLRVDSEGALIVEYPDSDFKDLLLHRTDSEGKVLDTTALPDRAAVKGLDAGTVLADVLVNVAYTQPADLGPGEEAVSRIVITPLGQGEFTEENTERFDFSSELLSPPEEGEDPETVRYELTPVPGALVLTLDSSGVTELHGLVS